MNSGSPRTCMYNVQYVRYDAYSLVEHHHMHMILQYLYILGRSVDTPALYYEFLSPLPGTDWKSCSTFVWSEVGGYILDAPVLPTSRAVAEEVITLFMTLAIEYFI